MGGEGRSGNCCTTVACATNQWAPVSTNKSTDLPVEDFAVIATRVSTRFKGSVIALLTFNLFSVGGSRVNVCLAKSNWTVQDRKNERPTRPAIWKAENSAGSPRSAIEESRIENGIKPARSVTRDLPATSTRFRSTACSIFVPICTFCSLEMRCNCSAAQGSITTCPEVPVSKIKGSDIPLMRS